MASPHEMQTYRALSRGEKWRVTRLVKGEAPDDPGMAVAAVELAASYQRREGGTSTLFRWVAIILVLIAGGLGVLTAAKGDVLLTIAMALLALTNIAHLALTRRLGQRTWRVPGCVEAGFGRGKLTLGFHFATQLSPATAH